MSPLAVRRRRNFGGFVDKILNKDDSCPGSASKMSLLAETSDHDPSSSYSSFKGNSTRRSWSGDSDENTAIHKENFTISAVHSVRSENNLKTFVRSSLEALKPKPKKSDSPRTSAYQLIATAVSSSDATNFKSTPHEIEAIDKELQRMFKLQLGPLTLASDIAPLLELWTRLVQARIDYGRKRIVKTWADLSRATAIVAKKMTVAHIISVIDIQYKLIYPCPKGLRLPSDMLMALADRTATAALNDACEEELFRFCFSVGRLMDMATNFKECPSNNQSNTLSGLTTDVILRALSRAALITPLIEAGMVQLVRRAKQTAIDLTESTNNGINTAENTRYFIKNTLLISECLAQLGGSRIAAPARCLHSIALIAAEELDFAKLSEAMPWWKKVSNLPSKIKSPKGSTAHRMKSLLPSHTDMGTQEAVRYAGKAATYLANTLVPGVVHQLKSDALARLVIALRDATVDDLGMPSHEPLRQAIGLLVAEAVRRTALPLSRDTLRRSCVKEVIQSCRTRLLHVKFSLHAPTVGIATALATLESWKNATRTQQYIDEMVIPETVIDSDEKEATSIELHERFSDCESLLDDDAQSNFCET